MLLLQSGSLNAVHASPSNFVRPHEHCVRFVYPLLLPFVRRVVLPNGFRFTAIPTIHFWNAPRAKQKTPGGSGLLDMDPRAGCHIPFRQGGRVGGGCSTGPPSNCWFFFLPAQRKEEIRWQQTVSPYHNRKPYHNIITEFYTGKDTSLMLTEGTTHCSTRLGIFCCSP